jgi:hypothetical protein
VSVDDYHDLIDFPYYELESEQGIEDKMTQNMPFQMPSTQMPQQPQPTNGPQAGIYNMRAVDADLGFTNGSDTEPAKPQVAILFEFVDGPYKGTSITWYGFFTEKTEKSTLLALRTCGWQGNDLSDLSTVRGEAPCTIQIEADLEGVLRPKIRFVGGGAIAMKNVMTPEQKKAFAAAMMGKAAGVQSTPAQTQGTPNGAPSQAVPGNVGPTGQKFF